MKTNVNMIRSVFENEIKQRTKDGYFSATDLVRAGNSYRVSQGKGLFNFSAYLKRRDTIEFIETVENNKKCTAVYMARGKNKDTWVHPLIFIDLALAISSTLKVEVYQWLMDNLIKFREDSGDSYCRMTGKLFVNSSNKSLFRNEITNYANAIKLAVGVNDWESASQDQLKLRDKIQNTISSICGLLKDNRKAVHMGIIEHIPNYVEKFNALSRSNK